MGKPFAMGTDGPGTFSCSGLMRFIMRTTGVDANAPWVPEGYLSKYAPVAPGNLQPGDIVIYPNWATMYIGNGMLLNANQDLGYVTHTPMSVAGTPEGVVRPPYAGQSQGSATQPKSGAVDPQPQSVTVDPQPQSGVVDPLAAQPPLAGPMQYNNAGPAQYDAAGGGATQPPLDGVPPLNAGTTQYNAGF